MAGAIISNDMTLLLNKIERRLGLIPLTPHLPEGLQKQDWADIITNDTMVTFSRYYPNEFKMVVNDETCDKYYGDKHSHGGSTKENTLWYVIKDEVLDGVKLLGIKDIDWMDWSTDNVSITSSLGGGMYLPSMGCPVSTYENILALQSAADFNSLYNNGIWIDFQYPNRFAIKGIGNTNYDLDTFKVILLVQHRNLSTISPTKMETFENLCTADIANALYKNLRYYDNLETVFVNIDLHLSELQEEAQKRDQIIDYLKESYVSTSNDSAPIIWSV